MPPLHDPVAKREAGLVPPLEKGGDHCTTVSYTTRLYQRLRIYKAI